MRQWISLWPKRPVFRKTTWILILLLLLNPIAFDLAPVHHFNKLLGGSIAQATVADQDGLGIEGFWSFVGEGLGAGWKYSINTFSGNLVVQKDLVTIPGRGLDLGEGLVYNSFSTQAGVLGTGWKLESDCFVQEEVDGNVTFKDDDSTNHRFTKNPDGSYKAPDGVYLKLTKVDATTFTIKDKDISTYRYQNGYLTSVTDEKGNATSFSYDTSNRLTSVTDPSGRELTYSYDASGRLNSITDPANRTTTFSYDESGRLVSVTDAKNGVTGFAYNDAGRLSTLTDPNGHTTAFFYDADGKVSKVNDARTTQAKEYSTTFVYDASLLKTTVTDAAGKSVVYTHNASGNLIERQDGAGVTKAFEWDKNNLDKLTDASGSTSATYDSNGNITSVSDTLNASTNSTTTASYDNLNNPTLVTDPNGNQVTAKYDSKSNMLSSANPIRKEADAGTYDSYGNMTSSTDAGAPAYNRLQNGSFEWTDSDGKPQFWSLGGNPAAISVDTTTARYGNASVKISSAAETSAFLQSREVSIVGGQKLTLSANVKMDHVTGTEGVHIGLEYYDSCWSYLASQYCNTYAGTGNTDLVVPSIAPTGAAYAIVILEMKNASGSVWFDGAQLESPVYDTEGNILSRFDYVENSSFEAGGSYWYAGGASGAVTISTAAPWAGNYSAKVNLTSSGSAWVRSSSISVRPGEPLSLSGFIKTVNIAGTGARIQIQYYDKNNTYLGYNTGKLQVGTQDYTRYAIAITPPANTAYVLVFGNVLSSTGTAYFDNLKLVSRSTTTYTYDSNGNYLKDVVDPLRNWTNYEHDVAGNRTLVNDPKGNITRFTYDSLNNLASVTDPLGNISRYEYDPVSMQVAYLDARSESSTDTAYKTMFRYNELNQLIGITEPLGRETTTTYDDAGNLASTTFPNGKKVLYAYDQANRLSEKSYSADNTTYSYSYDAAGNLIQVSDEETRSYQYGYDKANRQVSSTDVFGYQLNYTLDKADNIASITDSSNKTTVYTYGSANQLLTLTDPAGRQAKYYYDEEGRVFEVVKGNETIVIIRYDEVGRVKQIADPGNPDGKMLSYTYDANGNIVSASVPGGVENFTYDALNRLTSWTDTTGTVSTYEYDAVGNLTKKGSKAFTYNAANEITNAGCTYDANGNLTSDSTFNYEYDSENQLIKVTRVSDGSTIATYDYDYKGRRISKTTVSGTIRYHWDGDDRLVRESDADGNTIALYFYNNNDQLVAIEKASQMYYTHTNHRGDILAITDVNKNRVATFAYGPWGEPLSKTGSFEQPFRYAGYYFDEETGLYYLKARYYNPELGRFLTKDTVEGINSDPQTLNLYAYCSGNPVSNIDPDGHVVVAIVAAPLVGYAVNAIVAVGTIAYGAYACKQSGPIGKPNRKKQGREVNEGKRSKANWQSSSNKNPNRPQKKHTPSKKHRKRK